MSQFITIPELRWAGGEYPWEVVSPLVWEDDEIGRVIVPSGYCTDLASVPRIPLVYAWTGGRANMPAILHDYLYDCWTDRITRKQADQAFLRAMGAMREPGAWLTRRAMYAGVRVGGWRGWRKDSTDKCGK